MIDAVGNSGGGAGVLSKIVPRAVICASNKSLTVDTVKSKNSESSGVVSANDGTDIDIAMTPAGTLKEPSSFCWIILVTPSSST